MKTDIGVTSKALDSYSCFAVHASQDKTWLERTSETVKDSVGTGFDAVQRRLGRTGSGAGDSRYMSHNGGGGDNVSLRSSSKRTVIAYGNRMFHVMLY